MCKMTHCVWNNTLCTKVHSCQESFSGWLWNNSPQTILFTLAPLLMLWTNIRYGWLNDEAKPIGIVHRVVWRLRSVQLFVVVERQTCPTYILLKKFVGKKLLKLRKNEDKIYKLTIYYSFALDFHINEIIISRLFQKYILFPPKI